MYRCLFSAGGSLWHQLRVAYSTSASLAGTEAVAYWCAMLACRQAALASDHSMESSKQGSTRFVPIAINRSFHALDFRAKLKVSLWTVALMLRYTSQSCSVPSGARKVGSGCAVNGPSEALGSARAVQTEARACSGSSWVWRMLWGSASGTRRCV